MNCQSTAPAVSYCPYSVTVGDVTLRGEAVMQDGYCIDYEVEEAIVDRGEYDMPMGRRLWQWRIEHWTEIVRAIEEKWQEEAAEEAAIEMAGAEA